jgi:transcriptional regulator with XRE-family HTH domain
MNRIEEYIDKNGIKKKKLAEKLGVSRPTLDKEILRDTNEFYEKVKGSAIQTNTNSPHGANIAGDKNKITSGNDNLLYIIENQKQIIETLKEQVEFYKGKCKD